MEYRVRVIIDDREVFVVQVQAYSAENALEKFMRMRWYEDLKTERTLDNLILEVREVK